MGKGSNYAANTQFFWDRAGIAIGTHRRVVAVAGLSDLNFQWHNYNIDGIASITIYSTNLIEERDLQELDPALAPAVWRDETPSGAVFPTLPIAAAPGTDRVDVVSPGFANIMIEMVVTQAFVDFSLSVRGQGRSG